MRREKHILLERGVSSLMIARGKEVLIVSSGEARNRLTNGLGLMLHHKKWMQQWSPVSSTCVIRRKELAVAELVTLMSEKANCFNRFGSIAEG